MEDNDRSAYSGKPRWAYQQLLQAVEVGEIDAIVTWHNDRLHRSPKDEQRTAGWAAGVGGANRRRAGAG